jgi:hypothetical protein
MPMALDVMRNRPRQPTQTEVDLTETPSCLYCGLPTAHAECEQCGAALESLKTLTWTPVVKHRLPVPSV